MAELDESGSDGKVQTTAEEQVDEEFSPDYVVNGVDDSVHMKTIQPVFSRAVQYFIWICDDSIY